MLDEALPDLDGKVVVVQLPADGHLWVLSQPRFVKHMGRIFLNGKAISPNPGQPFWATNTQVSIPWEMIAYYVVFESIDAYQRQCHGAVSPMSVKRSWFGKQS